LPTLRKCKAVFVMRGEGGKTLGVKREKKLKKAKEGDLFCLGDMTPGGTETKEEITLGGGKTGKTPGLGRGGTKSRGRSWVQC